MAKDFFDEEYEKKSEQNNADKGADSWFDRPAPQVAQTSTKKPLYIVIACIALVLCIALGWVLCTVFQGVVFTYNTDGAGASNHGGDILDTVIKYLKEKYYMDIDDEQWIEAIEYSGSALMQKAGDKYSQLMSPQTYYDFLYPTTSDVTSTDGVFGVSFVVEEGVGLYVSSVVANSSAYGQLKEGDIILKLTEIEKEDGTAPVIDGVTFSEMVVGEWKSASITELLKVAKKANFHVLRLKGVDNEQGFDVLTVPLERRVVTPIVTPYRYNFIEFYFDKAHRNISMASDGVPYSTYEERHLDQLEEGVTGYVRLTQFMDYAMVDSGGKLIVDGKGNPVMVSAAQEFKEVMDLFKELGLKRLVLDLKGNPGGNVSYVSDIAGMLVSDAKLSEANKAAVNNKKGELLITTLKFPKFNYAQEHWRTSSYSNYFGAVGEKCSIVVWTDGGSASASELLTGALLDYGTAVQMGATTYGKGIAQTWEELPFYGTVTDVNGNQVQSPWAIYYTCASYYSPLGKNIHKKGYTPQTYNNLTNYADLWNAAKTYWN